MPVNERTPLLDDRARNFWDVGPSADVQHRDTSTFHNQFCRLVGVPPSDLPPDAEHPPVGPKTLYGRAVRMKKHQATTYAITAAISNTLLLTQVVLGAAVTALGASASSHVLITLFGAANTIIAGVVAYLKSRGQPMRARMYRDDLERVVDEIENSEIMWLGISKSMHGYSEINTDDEVTVRSEVARLTRLYDRAIRTNSMNNPDMYMAGGGFENTNFAIRKGALPSSTALPAAVPPAVPAAPGAAAAAPGGAAAPPTPMPLIADPDESPATAPPKPPPKEEPKEDKTKDDGKDSDKDNSKPSESESSSPAKSNGKAPVETTTGTDHKDDDATAGAGSDGGSTVNEEEETPVDKK